MRTFLVYALVELAVLAALAWSIGLGWTLVVLLATSVAGVVLAGSQVKRQLSRLRRTRATRRPTRKPGGRRRARRARHRPGLRPRPGHHRPGNADAHPPTRSAVRPLAGMLLTRGIARRVSVVNLVPPAGYPGRGDYIDGEVIDEQVFAPVHQAGIVRRVDA